MRFAYGRVAPSRKSILFSNFTCPCLLLLVCLTACSTTPTNTPPSSHSTPPVSTRTYHGSITYGTTQFPISANPLFASSSADFALNTALWGQPVFYDQQFHVHADQLTEVPLPENGGVQDGGKTILLHLRHDLFWSDGQQLRASDFAYWWHLNQDTNTGATTRSGYDAIGSIETPDFYTVVLHMKHPFGPYLSYLPYAAPEHAWSKFRPIDLQNQSSIFLAPQVTSGPYAVKSIQDGQSYTLVPNPHYRSSSFRGPFAAELIFHTYPSASNLVAAVQQQLVDVTTGYTEDDLPLLAHLPSSTKLLETPAAAYVHLEYNNAQPLFADVRVRRAIQEAINVCDLLKTVLHQTNCTRRATQVEPLPSLYYDAKLAPTPYNPVAAKQMLAESGWRLDANNVLSKDGRTFILRLATTQSPLRLAVATYIQKALTVLGIKVQLSSYSLSDFFNGYTKGGILATGAFDMALFTYENSPEPDDQYNVFHSSQIPTADSPALGNYARVNDSVIDAALLQGRNTTDFTARVTAYHTFLQRLAQQVYVIPLYVEPVLTTVATRVQNVLPNPNPALPTWNIADWQGQ